MEKQLNIAIIACGNRARGVVKNLLNAAGNKVKIASVYDPDPAEMDYACSEWKAQDALHCASSVEAINVPGVDWVMIFSPNAFHKQHILESFAAGKHVFTEKPLATKRYLRCLQIKRQTLCHRFRPPLQRCLPENKISP